MNIYNSTENKVFLCGDCINVALEPGESIIVDGSDKVVIELKHDYGSSAMNKNQIASDHNDTSLMSLVLLSHKEPYFNLVLNCKYEITGAQDTEICIKKQTIRPVYSCSYDRLFPVVKKGTVKELYHIFRERKAFEKHYLNAISSGNKKVITILSVILAIGSLPILLICFLVNRIIGLIVLMSASTFVFLAFLFGTLISKMLCKADCSLIFTDFESDRIIKYFKENTGDGSVS